ncbi:hypothetical protein [Oceanisphaera sp. KMM 10153]|uniref:hypothetical protein n=1 Tax=Oceanisphaera submarina TaxID=3390193 RepID=UPI0039764174
MTDIPSPSHRCEQMSRYARDGDTAYHYHQMAEHWRRQESRNHDDTDRAALD